MLLLSWKYFKWVTIQRSIWNAEKEAPSTEDYTHFGAKPRDLKTCLLCVIIGDHTSCPHIFWISNSQSIVWETPSSTSSGTFLEMQITNLYPRFHEPEIHKVLTRITIYSRVTPLAVLSVDLLFSRLLDSESTH